MGKQSYTSKGCNEVRFEQIVEQKNILFKHIESFRHENIVSQAIKMDIPNLHELDLTLKDFIEFFNDYFEYFVKLDKSAYSATMSCEALLSNALYRIEAVWQVLSWSINQRFVPIHREKLSAINHVVTDLFDYLPERLVDKKRRPIIYFDKIVRIVRFPYPSTPLIGLSMTASDQEAKLAYAHELGHHIFWNRDSLEKYGHRMDILHQIIYDEIDKEISNSSRSGALEATRAKLSVFEVLSSWAEEIFADIIGTLLTGAEYTKSSQDILIRRTISTKKDLYRNDGQHPMPILRPLVTIQVLKSLKPVNQTTPLLDIVEILESRWESYTGKFPSYLNLKNASMLKTDLLKTCLLNVVDRVTTDLISVNNEKSSDKAFEYWGMGENKGGKRADERFEDYLFRLIDEISNDKPSDLPDKTSKPNHIDYDANQYNEFDKYVTFIKDQRAKNISVEERPLWMDILRLNLTKSMYRTTCIRIDESGNRENVRGCWSW